MIVTHTMACAPGMPGDADEIALKIPSNCPVVMKTLLESLSNFQAQGGHDFDTIVNGQKKHFAQSWSQGRAMMASNEERVMTAVTEGEGEDEATIVICFHNIREKDLWQAQLREAPC